MIDSTYFDQEISNWKIPQLRYDGSLNDLIEEQIKEIENDIENLNNKLEQLGLSITKPFEDQVFSIIQSEYNTIRGIYFFSHLKEYHQQIVHYSKSEISSKLKVIQELQDQISNCDKVISNSSNEIKQLQQEIIDLKSVDNDSEIKRLKERNKLLKQANDKLKNNSSKYYQTLEKLSKIKIEVNKDEYKRKEFGKNLIDLTNSLGERLNVDLANVEEITEEHLIFEKVQENLITLIKSHP